MLITSLNNDIDRFFWSILVFANPSLCKMLIKVEYISNGVVNFLVLFRMLAIIVGYLCLNHFGSTKEKNGILSSNLPCCVSRTDANLWATNNINVIKNMYKIIYLPDFLK